MFTFCVMLPFVALSLCVCVCFVIAVPRYRGIEASAIDDVKNVSG